LLRRERQRGEKRVQRLMRLMGLEALGRKPKTGSPSARHYLHPMARASST
jgi:hypothetical protein